MNVHQPWHACKMRGNAGSQQRASPSRATGTRRARCKVMPLYAPGPDSLIGTRRRRSRYGNLYGFAQKHKVVATCAPRGDTRFAACIPSMPTRPRPFSLGMPNDHEQRTAKASRNAERPGTRKGPSEGQRNKQSVTETNPEMIAIALPVGGSDDQPELASGPRQTWHGPEFECQTKDKDRSETTLTASNFAGHRSAGCRRGLQRPSLPILSC